MGGIRASIRTVSQLRFCRGKTHLPRQINPAGTRAGPPSVLGLLPRQCYRLVEYLRTSIIRSIAAANGPTSGRSRFATANNKQKTEANTFAAATPYLPGHYAHAQVTEHQSTFEPLSTLCDMPSS